MPCAAGAQRRARVPLVGERRVAKRGIGARLWRAGVALDGEDGVRALSGSSCLLLVSSPRATDVHVLVKVVCWDLAPTNVTGGCEALLLDMAKVLFHHVISCDQRRLNLELLEGVLSECMLVGWRCRLCHSMSWFTSSSMPSCKRILIFAMRFSMSLNVSSCFLTTLVSCVKSSPILLQRHK